MKVFVALILLVSIANALPAVKVPKYLGIYYGWPPNVQNSNGDVTKAVNWFKKFDLLVFGDGLWNPATNGDYAKCVNITRSLVALGKKVFGYVDLGVTTQNLAISAMQTAVNGWITAGANVRVLHHHEREIIDWSFFVSVCRVSFGMMLAPILV